jgi:two-component system, NtrC family, sensor kinase
VASRRSVESAARDADRLRIGAMRVVAVGSAIATALGALAAVRQYRAIVGPVERMRAAARRLTAGELDARVGPINADAELSQLAADFDLTADRLAALCNELEARVDTRTRELIRAERLAGLGQLAAGVAHEINNPLGIIAGYGEQAMRRLAPDAPMDADRAKRVRDAIGVMCDEAFRCKQITTRLLRLAEPASATRLPVSVAAVARETVSAVAILGRFKGRDLSVRSDATDDRVTIHADPAELRQLVMNLVINALEALPPGAGHVWVDVHSTDAHGNGCVTLCVRDDGCGMSPELIARVFDPFVTGKAITDTDGPRRGTGLGLSVAHAIAAAHGATIVAESPGPGRGAAFTVTFPRAGVTHG